VTGGNNMTLVTNCALSVDRFGAANSALAMTSGTGGFTIMLWVKIFAFAPDGTNTRFIDLSSGSNSDSVRCAFLGTGKIRLVTCQATCYIIDSVGVIQLNQWTHVAASVNGSDGYIYINGILDFQGSGRFFLH